MLKRMLNRLFKALVDLGGPRWKTYLWYLRVHHRVPNLSSPSKFSEKIAVMKLRPDHSEKIQLTDKVLVKHFVEDVLGSGFAIPTLWSGPSLPPVIERTWPVPFVIKANHGSQMNYFVRTEADLNWEKIEAVTGEWLRRDWPDHLCEDWYNRIDRQLLVEPMIGTEGQDLPDFKFFVFSGRALLVQVDTNRFSRHTRAYYDRAWVKMPVAVAYPLNTDTVPPPMHLSAMLTAAERLGEKFDFVRVDFYDLPEGPKFGEITFAPDAGLGRFNPRSFDLVFGSMWQASADSRSTDDLGVPVSATY